MDTKSSEDKTSKRLGWRSQLCRVFDAGIASCFIVHGNVEDYFRVGESYFKTHFKDHQGDGYWVPPVTRYNIDPLDCQLVECKGFLLTDFYSISEGLHKGIVLKNSFTDGNELAKRIKKANNVSGGSLLETLSLSRSTQETPFELFTMFKDYFTKKSRANDAVCLIIEHPELMFSTEQAVESFEGRTLIDTLLHWAKDENLRCQHMIVLMTRNPVMLPASLRSSESGIIQIGIPKPSYSERLHFIKYCQGVFIELPAWDAATGEDVGDWYDPLSKLSVLQVASLTAGLNLRQIEEIFMIANRDHVPLAEELILAKKKEIFNEEYGDVLELIEPKRGFDTIGGLDYLRDELLFDVKNMQDGNTNVTPMGLMLMGPPGTGKSAIAEALAKDGGVPVVKLKNIRHWLVGRSEYNYYKALEGIRALVPVIVIEDEADQSEQTRDEYSGDSGVSNRIRQARFEFTSDPDIRGRVLWVKITNRPDKIDSAEKRSGRADKRIPLILPDTKQKAQIFAVMPHRYDFECAVKDFSVLAKYLEKIHDYVSGADIEEIMRRSLVIAKRKERSVVKNEDIRKAIDDFIPAFNKEEIDRMTYLSLKSCSSKGLMPPHAIDILGSLERSGY